MTSDFENFSLARALNEFRKTFPQRLLKVRKSIAGINIRLLKHSTTTPCMRTYLSISSSPFPNISNEQAGRVTRNKTEISQTWWVHVYAMFRTNLPHSDIISFSCMYVIRTKTSRNTKTNQRTDEEKKLNSGSVTHVVYSFWTNEIFMVSSYLISNNEYYLWWNDEISACSLRTPPHSGIPMNDISMNSLNGM